LGNGDGTFQSPQTGPEVGNYPTFVLAVDLNGDGKLDLVVANNEIKTGNLNISLGNGDGTFRTAVAYTAGNSPNKWPSRIITATESSTSR
jgi:hypothetical protein